MRTSFGLCLRFRFAFWRRLRHRLGLGFLQGADRLRNTHELHIMTVISVSVHVRLSPIDVGVLDVQGVLLELRVKDLRDGAFKQIGRLRFFEPIQSIRLCALVRVDFVADLLEFRR